MIIRNAASRQAAGATDAREQVRRRIVNVIFIIYWLLIFEGALRKWLFPGIHKILYFIRDPFVIYVYYLVIKHRMWPPVTPQFACGLIMAVLFVGLGLLHTLVEHLNPIVPIVGWRGYFWYLPLAFIIGEHFRGKDLARLCRETLIVSIPIAVLTFFQFRSGPFSFLNKTYDDEAGMMLTNEVVRTSGTFTVAAGQVLFIGSIIAMISTMWLLPARDRPLNRVLLWLSTAAVLVNLYVSGSRSAFFAAAFSLVAAMLSGLVMTDRRQQLRCLIWPGAISLLGAALYVNLFSTAFEIMAARQAAAQANEGSTFARAVAILTSLFETLPRSTLLGYGLGLGSNAGIILATGLRKLHLAENELPRIVEESGLLGVAYVIFRFWLFFWILWGAITTTRRINNPLPLLLFSFTGVLILVGQLTLQGTINGYGWLFTGFSMAAMRINLKADGAPKLRLGRRPG